MQGGRGGFMTFFGKVLPSGDWDYGLEETDI